MEKNSFWIYVVDDDASARTALGRLLKSADFKVKLFASAVDFLDCGPFTSEAVIILDVRMPKISGLELQKILMDSGKTIPIIFLTAFDDNRARKKAIDRGAVAFLQKPIDDYSLFQAITQARFKVKEIYKQ